MLSDGYYHTLAEPDLQVLANQVPSIPNNTLIFTVALGVGVFLVIAVLRILFRISLPVLLCIFYIALFFLSFALLLILLQSHLTPAA